ncbi:MAG: UDP-N-acetylglucosamine 2-epimerase (non-hydrolyzing) [Clostridia bacterium]|nr:UDP-N-acetylglucosamine 2-epimerase (non-hydrolyzing) [Clostridia bacterium]
MKRIMAVFGTRPDAIKMCPLVNELRRRRGVEVTVCVSGQHREMLDTVLEAFGVEPDYDLSVMKEEQSLFDITESIMSGIRPILLKEKPDVVLVHGDTTTAFAAALACFYLKIPVAHVEAGLRTYSIYSPYPEEFNRRAVSLVSDIDFAPTKSARYALVAEGKKPDRVYVTGNTVLDALAATLSDHHSCPELEWARGSRLILLTTHRRENIGEPMRNIFKAVRRIIEDNPDVKLIYPVHMNPEIVSIANEMLAGEERIMLTKPLGVVDFHHILDNSYLVLTDSGGIQEEAAALGKPTLILRDVSERREELLSGTIRIIGTREDEVYSGIGKLLNNEAAYMSMFRERGLIEGGASAMIADILCSDNEV